MMPLSLAILHVRRYIDFIDRQKDQVARDMAARQQPGDKDLEWAFLNVRLGELNVARGKALALVQDLEKHEFRPETYPVPRMLRVPLRRPKAERKKTA